MSRTAPAGSQIKDLIVAMVYGAPVPLALEDIREGIRKARGIEFPESVQRALLELTRERRLSRFGQPGSFFYEPNRSKT